MKQIPLAIAAIAEMNEVNKKPWSTSTVILPQI